MWYSLFRGRFWGCGPSRGASGAAALISMDMEAVEMGIWAIGLLLLCSVVIVAVVVVIGASSPAAAAAASTTARFE